MAQLVDVAAVKEVEWVTYPHRKVIDGVLSETSLQWKTGETIIGMDVVQQRSMTEGYLAVPRHTIFSASEARSCLRNKRVAFIGDSYIRILMTGLADVILGDPSSKETRSRNERISLFEDRLKRLRQMHLFDGSFPRLYWILSECYFDSVQCLTDRLGDPKSPARTGGFDAIFVNSLTHSLRQVGGSSEKYDKQLEQFFKVATSDLRLNLTWVSAPSVDLGNTPLEYRNLTMNLLSSMTAAHFSAYRMCKRVGIPFLDVYSPTKMCPRQWGNCTTDGSHRARYVLRDLAQLLLNNLCRT